MAKPAMVSPGPRKVSCRLPVLGNTPMTQEPQFQLSWTQVTSQHAIDVDSIFNGTTPIKFHVSGEPSMG